MTTWFEFQENGISLVEDTLELTLTPNDKLIEHVDSSTIVESPHSRSDFMLAYEEAIRRQE